MGTVEGLLSCQEFWPCAGFILLGGDGVDTVDSRTLLKCFFLQTGVRTMQWHWSGVYMSSCPLALVFISTSVIYKNEAIISHVSRSTDFGLKPVLQGY